MPCLKYAPQALNMHLRHAVNAGCFLQWKVQDSIDGCLSFVRYNSAGKIGNHKLQAAEIQILKINFIDEHLR